MPEESIFQIRDLFAFAFGFAWGFYICRLAFKGEFKAYRDELYKQYTKALKIMKDKIESKGINSND